MDRRKIKRYKSGLTLITRKNKRKKAIYVQFSFHAGLLNDPEGKPGLSHLVEHIIGLSNEKYTREEKKNIRNKFFGSNFSTSNDMVCLYAYVANDQLDDVFAAYSNWITDFKIDEKEFENEKKVVIQEILRHRVDTRENLMNLVSKTLYPKWKNPEILPFGTVDAVQSMTYEDVMNFINQIFAINNLEITVYGDFCQFKLNRLINKYIVKELTIKSDKSFARIDDVRVDTNYDANIYQTDSPDGVKSIVNIIQRLPLEEIDFLNSHPFRLINENILSAALKYFRYNYGLCYSASVSIIDSYSIPINNNKKRVTLAFEIYVTCDENNVGRVLEVLPGFYGYLKEYLLTTDRKKELETNFKRFEKVIELPSFNKIGERIAREFFRHNNFDYSKKYKKYEKKSKKLNVDKINEYLKKACSPKPFIFIASNTKDKLLEYDKLCADIKSHCDWITQ